MSERTWVAEADLPSPRIQLRWRPAKDTEYKRFGQCTWMCRYELVLLIGGQFGVEEGHVVLGLACPTKAEAER